MKKIKIGKKLRDLVLRREETYVIKPGKCNYCGEIYYYDPFTDKEIREMTKILLERISPKPWFSNIFESFKKGRFVSYLISP